MPRIYATEADLASWTGKDAPANAAALLRHASTLVEGATQNAYYSTDTAGLPTLPKTLGAFESATCAQAAFWAANDLDPAAGTLPIAGEKVAASKSIKGASVSYDTGAAQASKEARIAALQFLCLEAWQILDNEGLITGAIR